MAEPDLEDADKFASVSKCVLDINSLEDVLNACQERFNWNPVGLCLGLSRPQLEEIAAGTNDSKERLQKVLAAWLQKDTLPGSPDPSYYTLCQAVAKGGGNPALAEKIAAAHPASADADIQMFKDVVDLKKLSKEGVATLATFKQCLEGTVSGADIRLLVVGKTGEGKSTLINSIIDLHREIAKEGAGADLCTNTIQQYSYTDVIPGVNVTLIDTPGLQDIYQRDQSYIQLMKSECQEVSLFLYCMKMTDHRLTNDDMVAMQKLHQAFGPKFWERVIFVLTFANREDCDRRDDRDDQNEKEPPLSDRAAWEDLIKRRFIVRVQNRASEMKRFLHSNVLDDYVLDLEKISFVPAGDYRVTFRCPSPLQLPDQENWLYKLLSSCCHCVKDVHEFKKLGLSDKIHLAIIIDNVVITTDENDLRAAINNQAREIKGALEKRGFCVLYFNGLNSHSIACLLKSLQHVDHSELASCALVILSKGKTHHVYDVNNEQVSFEDFFHPFFASEKAFAKIPKLFFFHLSHFEVPENKLVLNVRLPHNSIALAVTVCPNNNAAITAFVDGLSSISKNIKTLITWFKEVQAAVQGTCNSSELVSTLKDKFVLPTCYEPSNERQNEIATKKKLYLYRTMWHHARYNTIDILIDVKDEVLAIVRAERIAKIAASSVSIAVGGGLVVVGLALIPFTFGGSIALSVAGGVIGAAAGGTGIGALITSKLMASRKLKKAQQHISLDQQLSKSINEVAAEYSELMKLHTSEESRSDAGELTFDVTQSAAAGISRIGVVTAVGAQGVVETSAIALRTTGRVAGMALAGATLAVTVPMDIGMIAYNSFLLLKSFEDKSGKNEKDVIVKWFVKQTEEMLKGTLTPISMKEYSIGEDKISNEDDEYGCKVLVPSQLHKTSTIAVRTILSGTFNLPEGATLVSAVYDVLMEEKLPAPVAIEIEHCVDITDQSTAVKMTFATATVDFDKKAFEFTPLEGGTFPQGQTRGSISLSDSSLLCILYYSQSLQDQLMIKYAAQCSTTRECRNYSKMNIIFTKSLRAHHKSIQLESAIAESHTFTFTRPTESPYIELDNFKKSIKHNGWLISPNSNKNIPNSIHKKELDTAELQKFSKPHSSEIFPSLTLDIQVEDEERASDELRTSIEVTGTDLRLVFNQRKE